MDGLTVSCRKVQSAVGWEAGMVVMCRGRKAVVLNTVQEHHLKEEPGAQERSLGWRDFWEL